MIHYIICKWKNKEEVTAPVESRIRELFSGADSIPGVEKAEIVKNAVDRDNRFDLMIRVYMNKDALPVWDNSDIHRRWKEEFGGFIDKKTIFDEE